MLFNFRTCEDSVLRSKLIELSSVLGIEITKSDINAILATPTRQRPYYNFVAKQQDSQKRYSVLQKGSPKCQGLCFTWGLHPKGPYPAKFEDHEVPEESRER